MSAVSNVVIPFATCVAMSEANMVWSISPCPPASCQQPAVIREIVRPSPIWTTGIEKEDAIGVVVVVHSSELVKNRSVVSTTFMKQGSGTLGSVC